VEPPVAMLTSIFDVEVALRGGSGTGRGLPITRINSDREPALGHVNSDISDCSAFHKSLAWITLSKVCHWTSNGLLAYLTMWLDWKM
jgi:hypothetical protein